MLPRHSVLPISKSRVARGFTQLCLAMYEVGG